MVCGSDLKVKIRNQKNHNGSRRHFPAESARGEWCWWCGEPKSMQLQHLTSGTAARLWRAELVITCGSPLTKSEEEPTLIDIGGLEELCLYSEGFRVCKDV